MKWNIRLIFYVNYYLEKFSHLKSAIWKPNWRIYLFEIKMKKNNFIMLRLSRLDYEENNYIIILF